MSARDQIDDIVDRFVDEFTTECNCGDYGCSGRSVPRKHDPRVVAATLSYTMTQLADRWDPDLARAAADYASRTARSAEGPRVISFGSDAAAFTG